MANELVPPDGNKPLPDLAESFRPPNPPMFTPVPMPPVPAASEVVC